MGRVVFLLATFLASHAIAESRHAGAHVHGDNHAKLILSDSSLQISYEFPIVKLAKYDEHKHDEHKHDEHKHDEHKHDELAEQLAEINSITTLVAIPDGANCSQSNIRQELRAVASTGHDDEHASHQDVIIEAVLTCKNPSVLNSMDFSPAFNNFDDVEKIKVEGILGTQSISGTLTARKAVIHFDS